MIFSRRHVPLDLVQEADEFLMPVALHSLPRTRSGVAPDDRPVQHVERREQGRRPVALVVMGHGRPAPLSSAADPGLGPVKRLNLRLSHRSTAPPHGRARATYRPTTSRSFCAKAGSLDSLN